jgi:acyl-CoA synthetase (AMP-forming)/AMP-acid ligase II
MGFSYRDVFIMGAPITHIAGLLLTAIVPPVCGARSVLLPAWDPDVAVRLADAEGGTFSCGATVFLQAYVERYERADAPNHRLSAFMCGGAAIPPSLIERADAVGIRAFRSWGLTEVPTIGLVGPDATLEERARRDGRVSEGTEVHAIDESGAILPPGQQGELRVRAPEQMLGYTDPERNAELVSADGWFRTGDVGSIDAGGWITMTGRIKDIINRGGEKFSAQDIENAIADHPDIASAAVIGAPDERLGETVVAFVTLRTGAKWPGELALIEHLETKRLAKQKRPTAWRVLDELPATLSGKTQKNLLFALWEKEAADSTPS